MRCCFHLRHGFLPEPGIPWPRLVDGSAGGSLVGMVMPRTNWLLVNRLDLAAFFAPDQQRPHDRRCSSCGHVIPEGG